jgi:CubicO group peptidase (beta-lactamase class C family)
MPNSDSPPLPRDAIFPLQSLTKPITATAAMMLVEDGLLGLNRPVAEHVPEFTGEGKHAVMVHHLLTHTSGLRDQELEACARSKGAITVDDVFGGARVPCAADFLAARYDAPLWQAPGMEMSYCSYNYELLGEIIGRVSGRPLATFAHERIFRPLGMVDSFYVVPDAVRHRILRRPADAAVADILERPELQEEPYASFGVYSTALDTAIFGQMFLNQGCYGDAQILSRAAVAEMTRNQIPGISARASEEYFPEASWSFGWNVHGDKKAGYDGSLRSARSFGHDGLGGVLLWVDPIYELVGAYFSVVLRDVPPFDYPEWCADLFINIATAAVVER